jgi:hypothetical protein
MDAYSIQPLLPGDVFAWFMTHRLQPGTIVDGSYCSPIGIVSTVKENDIARLDLCISERSIGSRREGCYIVMILDQRKGRAFVCSEINYIANGVVYPPEGA